MNPENIHNDFASILKDEIIASKVELKVMLHKGLKFTNIDKEDLSIKMDNDDQCMIRDIGNVT